MNPHILVVVHRPPKIKEPGIRELRESPEWANFEHNLLENTQLWPGVDTTGSIATIQSPAENNASVQRLAENVWLIPLQSGLPFLGKLVAQAKNYRLPCQCLYFEEPPAWIPLGDTPAAP